MPIERVNGQQCPQPKWLTDRQPNKAPKALETNKNYKVHQKPKGKV